MWFYLEKSLPNVDPVRISHLFTSHLNRGIIVVKADPEIKGDLLAPQSRANGEAKKRRTLAGAQQGIRNGMIPK